MGPLHLQQQLPMVLLGPITLCQAALPIPWNGPISPEAAVVVGLAWAHYCFQEVLPMPLDWPILFSTAVADGFAWSHYVARLYC